jgi:FixJ family two-component response regulator
VSDETSVIFVVDDDVSMRKALKRMFQVAGFVVEEFASAQDFLTRERPDELGCLVLDVRMPGMSGLTLQETLKAAGLTIPIVFLTGHGDVPASVRAMKMGAVDFLEKPFDRDILLDTVRGAIERHRVARQEEAEVEEVQGRLATLTPREREVLDLVVQGVLNKKIGLLLGITERTVKAHRAKVMEKLRVVSVAELARLVERVETAEERRG